MLLITLWSLFMSSQNPIPRPEHPRPDFQRELWLNLNGPWQFEIDAKADGEKRGLMFGKDLAQTIIVPFCPESKLSGIKNTDFMKHVWYRRTFNVPTEMKGKRLLLHFGAVDWLATVYVNGEKVGEHRGGYTPFCLDITEAAKPGQNEVVVQVTDDTASNKQATGKQTHDVSQGCVYTRTTGIWQTVYIEAAGQSYLREIQLDPDLDTGRLFYRCWVDGPQEGATLRARAFANGKQVGEETVPAAWRATRGVIKLSKVVPWAVGKPFLYDLTLEVLKGGKPLDTVHSYFGLRKVSIVGNRFLINDKPVFQRLILDQGFYPDGIYTAPTEEDLKHDIELSMAAGFNGARLHQKVFEPRLLYWADKLGYILWGEYPSWGLDWGDYHAVANAVNEWREELIRDRNHPAIIGWCPLNETPGDEHIAAAEKLFAMTVAVDPSRALLDSSGYAHLWTDTDVYDSHDYTQDPKEYEARFAMFGLTGQSPFNNNLDDPRSAYRGQPYFVSEYGGMRVKTNRKTQAGWGYGETSLEDFLARYKGLTDVMLDNPNMCGFCYTQLTDVEQEQNGIFFYDRKQKYDPALVKKINARAAAYEKQGPSIPRITWTPVVPASRKLPATWHFTISAPPPAWFKPSFDDSGWQSGPGGFGTKGTPGSVVGTEWNTSDIWIRRHFTLSDAELKLAAVEIHHDEDAEVYVNGKLVATLPGFIGEYTFVGPLDALAKALKTGDNVLAVHCHQTEGGQFIDVGIATGVER